MASRRAYMPRVSGWVSGKEIIRMMRMLRTHTHTCKYTHTKQTHAHAHIHTQTHTKQTDARTRARARAHTHIRTRTRTHPFGYIKQDLTEFTTHHAHTASTKTTLTLDNTNLSRRKKYTSTAPTYHTLSRNPTILRGVV